MSHANSVIWLPITNISKHKREEPRPAGIVSTRQPEISTPAQKFYKFIDGLQTTCQTSNSVETTKTECKVAAATAVAAGRPSTQYVAPNVTAEVSSPQSLVNSVTPSNSFTLFVRGQYVEPPAAATRQTGLPRVCSDWHLDSIFPNATDGQTDDSPSTLKKSDPQERCVAYSAVFKLVRGDECRSLQLDVNGDKRIQGRQPCSRHLQHDKNYATMTKSTDSKIGNVSRQQRCMDCNMEQHELGHHLKDANILNEPSIYRSSNRSTHSKRSGYADPLVGATPSFLMRVEELALAEQNTTRWETARCRHKRRSKKHTTVTTILTPCVASIT